MFNVDSWKAIVQFGCHTTPRDYSSSVLISNEGYALEMTRVSRATIEDRLCRTHPNTVVLLVKINLVGPDVTGLPYFASSMK